MTIIKSNTKMYTLNLMMLLIGIIAIRINLLNRK